MRNDAILDDKNARYRRRVREAGDREVLVHIPETMLAAIDELKKRQRLRSRSRALLQLIERGMQAAE